MRRTATQKETDMAGFVPAIQAPSRRDKATADEAASTSARYSTLTRIVLALPAAVISFLLSSEPAQADLKLCNRMSYVVQAAIGIDDKSATATRGWFRIDPDTGRCVGQGTLNADR